MKTQLTMGGTTVDVTLEDIKALIRNQGLLPQDLFEKAELTAWRDAHEYAEKVRADLRRDESEAAAREAAAAAAAKDKQTVEPKPKAGGDGGSLSKYVDPARNPMIKTS